MRIRRASCRAIPGTIVVTLLGSLVAASTAASIAGVPVSPPIVTVVGGAGSGAALDVAVYPNAVVASGPFVYMSDELHRAVRVLDTRTGQLRVIAGNGDPNPYASAGSDGVDATSTRLRLPTGIALHPSGDVYFSDFHDTRIRKVNASGIITTFVDDLRNPTWLQFDAAGNLFATELFDYRVVKIGPTGNRTDVTPPGGAVGQALPLLPSGLVLDPAGNAYIADGRNNLVYKRDAAGGLTTVAGGGVGELGDGGQATSATLDGPRGLALDGAGNLYIADSHHDRVRRVDAAGIITTVAGGGSGPLGDGGPARSASLSGPTGVTVDGDGRLYIADQAHRRIRRVDVAGRISTVAGNGRVYNGGDGGLAAGAQLRGPGGLAMDAAGNLFVSDTGNHVVRKVSPGGIITTVAGNGQDGTSGDGGLATQAMLRYPSSVAADRQGNLYIVDVSNDPIRKVDAGGVITVFAGGGTADLADGVPATTAKVIRPTSVAVDGSGRVYFSDGFTLKVWRVNPDGVLAAVTGRALQPDGSLGPAQPLWGGAALTFDSVGNLYVGRDQLVSRLDTNGIVTTVAGGGSETIRTEAAPAHSVALTSVTGLAVDADGELYIADNDRPGQVVKVDHYGMARRVAGVRSGSAELGDGGSALDARIDLGNLAGLALDSTGGLLIADSLDDRVRRIDGIGAAARILATGWNGAGQLGNGTLADRNSPAVVALPGGVRAASAGYYHSLAVTGDGSAWAWGWNGLGQLGDATTATRSSPVPVPGLVRVRGVAAGAFHSLAVLDDGSVWAWGWNVAGQLGDGSTVERLSPVRVSGLPTITAVSAGAYHSLALALDGSVWAWGWNGTGQLGLGTNTDSPSPRQVPGLAGVRSIAAGANHNLAATGAGALYAWGWNAFGQLGDGTTVDRSSPVQLSTPLRADMVSAGAYHSASRLPDGQIATWGWNGYGQLGADRATTSRSAPATVGGHQAYESISLGILHTVGLGVDGSVSAWGWNGYGQLGDGTTSDLWTPTHVAAMDGSSWISAGGVHTLAAH